MAKLLTTLNSVGNFLIREQWRDRNYCRADAKVDTTTTGDAFEVGEVVMQVGGLSGVGAGAFVELTDAFDPDADKVGIIVDERIQDPVFYNGTVSLGYGTNSSLALSETIQPDWKNDSVTLALLVRGDAMVRLDGLSFGSAGAVGKGLASVGLAKAGITFNTNLKGKYVNDSLRDFTPISA
jgi:hypothetical protein